MDGRGVGISAEGDNGRCRRGVYGLTITLRFPYRRFELGRLDGSRDILIGGP
jgi:hypothetical protein